MYRPAAGGARRTAGPAALRQCRAGRSGRAAGHRSTAAAPPARRRWPSAPRCRDPRHCYPRRWAACAPAPGAAAVRPGPPAAVPPGTPSASRDAARSTRSARGRSLTAPPSRPRTRRIPSAAGARGSCARPSRTVKPRSPLRPGPAAVGPQPACPCASRSRPAAGPARSRPAHTTEDAPAPGGRPSARPGSCRSRWWPGCRRRPAHTGADRPAPRPRLAWRPLPPGLRMHAAPPAPPCRWWWRGSARTGSTYRTARWRRRARGSGSYGSDAGRACQLAAKIAA